MLSTKFHPRACSRAMHRVRCGGMVRSYNAQARGRIKTKKAPYIGAFFQSAGELLAQFLEFQLVFQILKDFLLSLGRKETEIR